MVPEENLSHPKDLISLLFHWSTTKTQLGPPCWHFGPKCIMVYILRRYFLPVSCFPNQNKMAAELSTLASSFLETKPETYAPFFLECVESKQHLNIEVSKNSSFIGGISVQNVLLLLFSSAVSTTCSPNSLSFLGFNNFIMTLPSENSGWLDWQG